MSKYNPEKIVTIGPTRNFGNKELRTNKFSIYNIEFLESLDDLAKKLKIIFIISPHPTAEDLPKNIKKFIQSSDYLFTNNDFHLKNTFESLAVSDYLITDFSTLCIDNLFFENNLIILKSSINRNINLLSVLNDFNYFECNSFKELETMLMFSKKNILKNELNKKYIGFQNDMENSKRSFERIKLLLEN